MISKHLKGQLDPPVGNGHVFGPKEVSWTPLSVTSRFLDQWRSVGPPVGNGRVFWTKGGQLDPPVGSGHIFAPLFWLENPV